MIFYHATDFVDSYSQVTFESNESAGYNNVALIDTTGNEIVPPIYSKYRILTNTDRLVMVEVANENGRTDKVGIIKLTSKIEINPIDTADGWAHDAIKNAISNGYVPLDLQNTYRDVITRAEFCRMAVKWVEYVLGKDIDLVLAERGLSINKNSFADTSDSAILAAYALRITNGTVAPTDNTPGLFDPGGAFNRQQAAVMIMNTCRAIGADVSNPPVSDFIDLTSADTWAYDGINYVRAKGIMSGTSTTTPTFSPKDTYTRQQSIMTFNNIDLAVLTGN